MSSTKIKDIHVYIPESMTFEMELLLHDPRTGKLRYGARNDLFVSLLRDWLDRIKQAPALARQIDIAPDVPSTLSLIAKYFEDLAMIEVADSLREKIVCDE